MSDTTAPQASDAERIGISPHLLAMLVCPVDHARLRIEAERLVCAECGRAYQVRDGIPGMVVDEATA